MLFQLSVAERYRHSIKLATERFLTLFVIIFHEQDVNKYKSLLPTSIEKYQKGN